MVDQLYGLDVNFVDWRRFLLCAAHPWPLPSAQDVLEAWDAMVPERETIGRKTVSKEQFMGTEIWLDRPPEHVEELGGGFNRNHALKDVRLRSSCGITDHYTCDITDHCRLCSTYSVRGMSWM